MPWWRRRLVVVVVAVVGCAVAIAAVAVAAVAPRSRPTPAATPTEQPAHITTASTTERPSAERVWPQQNERVIDGWEIGAEGDLVSLGDWWCSGTRTPVVARPATGEVFVFDTWADGPSRLIGRVAPGLTAIRSAGCGRLEARLADGSVEVVEVAE